jgi:hypothetical protein
LGLYGCAPDHAPDPEPQKKESINSNAQTVPAFSPAPVRDVKRVPIRLSSKPLAKSFKGISLGMTLDQLKKLHPKVDRDDAIIDSDFSDCTHTFDQPNDCPHVYACSEDVPLTGDEFYRFKAIFVCSKLAKFEFGLLPPKMGMPFLTSCLKQYGPPSLQGKEPVTNAPMLVWEDPSTSISITESDFINGKPKAEGADLTIAISDMRLIDLSNTKRVANHSRNAHLQQVPNNPPYRAKIKSSFKLSETAGQYVDFVTADTPTQLAMAERGYNLGRPVALENETVTVEEVTTDRNFDMAKIKTVDGKIGWMPRDLLSLPIE